ncbi:alpha/beta fold hydrolase [Streptomonospora salina]|uniref:Pimeloyl-ACP methyl ester carboxylesterase n=1 Tax=Streptomonospora salina TaxID=104205 RepID=A0A841EJJ0_9ACTN|nr:alpha/beta hydrolase [Streptomonospora salina]MBB6000958.1 pimeloyl-ACP methyl ester carboxylesterase [Streptomonospora salina]
MTTSAAPTPRQSLTVHSADGTRLHAEIHGPPQAPPVVLAHGWTCSTRLWHPLIDRIGDRLRLICYDQRGHGKSQTPRGGPAYTTTALADDLIAVLDTALAPDERAVVAGHSMGAMTLMAAADRPRFTTRTAAALLASTGPSDLPRTSRVIPLAHRTPRLAALAHRALLTAPLPLGPRNRLTRAALHYATMADGADPATVEMCTRMVHAVAPAPRARWGRVLAGLDLDRGLTALTAPAVLLAGTDDRLTPRAHAHRMAGLLPDCRDVVEIPHAGHMTPLETPQALARALTDLADTHLAPRTHHEEPA